MVRPSQSFFSLKVSAALYLGFNFYHMAEAEPFACLPTNECQWPERDSDHRHLQLGYYMVRLLIVQSSRSLHLNIVLHHRQRLAPSALHSSAASGAASLRPAYSVRGRCHYHGPTFRRRILHLFR